MEFSWAADQQHRYDNTLLEVTRFFTQTPSAAETDRHTDQVPGPVPEPDGFSREAWRFLGDLGVLGACVPCEYGGQGLGALDTARVFEAVGRGCPDTGLAFAAAAHLLACLMPIVAFGSPALRERVLPGLCSGELVAGNAMTEAEAGSDTGSLRTTATRVPDGYLLNGTKTFVSNGPVADLLVVYATTDPEAGHWGTTGFVVEADGAGVVTGEPFAKLGLEGCQAGAIEFRDCLVPESAVVGEPGQGAAVFQHSMGWERACLFALYVGLQERLIDDCVTYARKRRQFGRRIAEFQSVSNRIVDMKIRLESARLLLYRTCWEMDQGGTSGLSAALSKLAVSEAALTTATDAVRTFGGRGFRKGFGIESALRDSVAATLFSGTSDIQRQLVAIELGL